MTPEQALDMIDSVLQNAVKLTRIEHANLQRAVILIRQALQEKAPDNGEKPSAPDTS